MNPELQSYIAQARASGMTDDAIRQTLISSGWDAGMVNAALSPSVPSAPVSPMPPAAPAALGASVAAAAMPSDVQYAGYWRKFFASLADGFIAFLPMGAVMTVSAVANLGVLATMAHAQAPVEYATSIGLGTRSSSTGGQVAVGVFTGILGFLALIWMFFYPIFYLGRRGATPGMRWRKIRMIEIADPSKTKLGYGFALGRIMMSAILSGLTGGLTYHWQLINPHRQEVADIIMKTAMLHEPSGQPSSSLAGIPERKKRWVWFLLPAPIFILSILRLIK